MTLIIASLFLPYGPQFDMDHLDEQLLFNLDQSLISIDTTDLDKLRAASPVYNFITAANKQNNQVDRNIKQVANPYYNNNTSQDSLLENYTLPRIKSNNSMDQLLTSEEFMANLTSHGSNTLTPTQSRKPNVPEFDNGGASNNHIDSNSFYKIGGKKNLSVHDFFKSKLYSNSVNNLHSDTSASSGTLKLTSTKSTEHLLKNVNRSLLLKSTLKHSFSSGQIPTIKQQNQTKRKSYKMNMDDTLEEQSQDDLPHFVPRFGGFRDRTNLKLRTIMMLHDQQKIFQNIPWKIVPRNFCNQSLRDSLLFDYSPPSLGNDNGGYSNSRNTTCNDTNINWIGTMGIPTNGIPQNVINQIQVSLENNHNCYSVMVDDDVFNNAYFIFCKKNLWPILHYQLPMNTFGSGFSKPFDPLESNSTDDAWKDYTELNKLVAQQCIQRYNEGDTIWIHDYHLMLVPKMIRESLPNAKIGFFHHVSFPSSELFRCLSNRNDILKGVLGANLISFQNLEYMRHFLQTCNRILMADITIPDKEIQYKGQTTRVAAIPMGIDPFRIQSKVINDFRVNHWRKSIREKWDGMKLILSRDSLDGFSGLVQKLKSYELFLRQNPPLIGKVTLLQICNVSHRGVTDSIDVKRQIMIIIDRINSFSFNINAPPPVMFLQQDLETPQILALYCECDLYWVNSLREGMNLTCHEFITCSIDKHSPLMISEFTGSASILKDGALLINPWDIDNVSKMIKYALYDMSPKLKSSNWKKMIKNVINNDSESWITKNLSMINTSWEHIQERATLNKMSYDSLIKDYRNAKKRFFLFKISSPPTPYMISILNDLTNNNSDNNNNIIYIMSSFSKTNLEILYNRVSNVGFLAENGAYLKLVNGSWYNMVDNTEWKSEVIKVFDDKVERLPGSYYKIYDSMIVFHTENAEDKERTSSVIGETLTHINTVFNESNIHAFVTSNNVMCVQQSGLSLKALKFILAFHNSFNDENIANNDIIETVNTLTDMKPMTINGKIPHSLNKGSQDSKTGDPKENQVTTQQTPIDFACVTGSSSPIIDPIFYFFKKKLEAGNIEYVHTVVYGSTQSTHALEHVNGLNDLMKIISRLNRP